jgi:lariat debranching enzyme
LAPKLTLFIGGNHEAMNHLRELYYGGWVAPNIYFVGYSGVVNFGGVRIAGFSGIFKSYDYFKGHYEKPPYDENSKRSAFHVKQYELWKLQQVRNPIDVIMSHDWPDGITKYGDEAGLLREKPYYTQDIENGSLGCKYYSELMQLHKPQWWISGHMHVFFKATVNYEVTDRITNFVACTKAVPYTDFLHVISIKPSIEGIPKQLHYDREWLAILKSMESYFPETKVYMVPKQFDSSKIENSLKWIDEEILPKGLLIPHNFTMTVTPHWTDKKSGKPPHKRMETDLEHNIQTIIFREWLGLEKDKVPTEAEKMMNNKKKIQSQKEKTNKKRVQHFQ